jgi:kynureninase
MNLAIYILAGVIGILAVLALIQSLQLSRLKARLLKLGAQPKQISVSEPTAVELESRLKAAYDAKIVEATATFGEDLKATSTRLSEQVSRLTTSVIEEELEAYQKTLEEVRHTAVEAMDKIRTVVEQQRVELRQGMEADLAAERDKLAAKFDTKMGDIVASYIAESLGGGVDLGAQMQFIMTSLEAHKDELKKDLMSGV